MVHGYVICMFQMIHGYVISSALGIQLEEQKSDNIADIVTPSSLTIATMASIHGSDFEFFDAISDISANSNGRSRGD